MRKSQSLNYLMFLFLMLFIGLFANAQDVKVTVIGGANVADGSVVSITAGNSISFRITNIRTDCDKVKIEDISISNTTDFSLVTDKVPKNVDSPNCKGNTKNIDFTITNISGNCGASTNIAIEIKQNPDFLFTFSISGSPEINIIGGNPVADVINGSTVTSSVNGTYFGVVDEGNTITRYYGVVNTGSCPMTINSLASSLGDFAVPTSPAPYVLLPNYSPTFLPATVDAGDYVILPVTFLAPIAGSGTLTSTITVNNTANTSYTFDVSAEMFNYNIPGPGGITADFRLWLKSTRGITQTASKVSQWSDLGTNGKHAIQPISANQPTYLDDATSNINFNPVLKFENDGGSLEQFMYNTDNGFYSQDIFIVMIPDATMTNASTRNTIFGGISSGNAGDITGVGFGDYSTKFTGETLSYNQDVPSGGSFNGAAELNSTYANAGIINVRNNAFSSPTGQEILYNSAVLTTSNVSDAPFVNVGTPSGTPVLGTEYWIGRNFDVQGSLNGRVAEIFTFAERVSDTERQKIESYLAIKYGITLGNSTQAQKDYINSFGTKVWDIVANSGYNYHIAGIGRDSISDLNQKQSKTLNFANEVTIGLDGVFATNSANVNEFVADGDFLVWGSNNAAYSASGSNTVTIASGITTSLTRILRQWKIVESKEVVSGDVGNVYVSIPAAAFASFALATDEEYVLIVADSDSFLDSDIIDVIPLKSDGGSNLQTWYDFDSVKYFTFGKASKLAENHSVAIGAADYLVGEYALNLNINDFTISAWVKPDASQTSTRTIMAKGTKLQLRLNSSHQVEVMVDNDVTPRFTSSMVLNDNKWHHISFVYNSGTIFLYIDGTLDKSEQNVVAPSPNFNRFSVGAVYIDKNNIINPFLGKIDEVYVWDQGLSDDQVRYLMNQEAQKGLGDFATGKSVPQGVTSNEVAAVPWSKLKAYYDFNAFYGSTVEGLTDERLFLRLKYLNKNKQLLSSQTIPVPYISIADGDWDNASTWANGADIVLPNSLSLDGSTSIDWNVVQIAHDINSGDRNISLLGLIQTSGTLTIADPNEVLDETNSGQALKITHYLELDGVIDLVGESQLIQTEGSVIDADSGGYIERDQQGTANGFNYNYWSSSVSPITGNVATRGTGVSSSNANYTITDVLKDGTMSGLYQDLNFSAAVNGSGTIPPPGFARTISTAWLYKFYGPADDYNAWIKITESTPLLAGEGFTMKGTSGVVSIATLQNYVFKGLPNNGDIMLPLNKISGTGDVERLIGNPYPSAIDAEEFILDNISTTEGGNNTNTVINGALYFWDHFGEENSHVLKEYVGGYATYNLTGGAPAISNDARINNTSNGGSAALGTKIPGQYIPVNQGFFVSTKLETHPNDNSGTISSVDGGTIIFKNSQRIYAPEDGATSLFFKNSKAKNEVKTAEASSKQPTPTIRLTYDSPLGYHRQIVLGANKRATKGFDLGYDAFMVDVNKEDMYWMLNDSKFVIQGVGSFDASQEFPIGLVVNKSGMVKIKLDALENIPATMALYIKDTSTGKVYQINNNPFEVHLNSGVYNDRFKLVFQDNTSKLLANVDVDEMHNLEVFYNSKTAKLELVNAKNTTVSNVAIYNLNGQELDFIKVNSASSQITIPVSLKLGIYVLELDTFDGVERKKIIVNQ